MRRHVLAPTAALALVLTAAPVAQAGGASSAAALCRHGGWQQLMGEDGTFFTSTGACLSHGARGGTLVPRDASPTAVDDAATVGGNLSTVVDVLANDHDPDGDPLTVSVLGAPAHGTATVLADGTVRYTPDLDFAGGDSFRYGVDDGRGGTDTATVTLTVVASSVTVMAVTPSQIDDERTIEIVLIIAGLPPGQAVTEVRFGHDDDWVGLTPNTMTIPTRVPVTIPRLLLMAGTYDVAVLTSDGGLTTAAVLPDGLTVLSP